MGSTFIALVFSISLLPSCKTKNTHNSLSSHQFTSAANCQKSFRILLDDFVPPTKVTKSAKESLLQYFTRLENKLEKLGGNLNLSSIKNRKKIWKQTITKLDTIKPESKIPTLKRSGKHPLSDSEFELLSAQYEKNRRAYIGIMDFFNSGSDLYNALYEIEIKTQIEMLNSNITHSKALEIILTQFESNAGFAKAIDLPDRFVSPKELLQIVKEGNPVRDLYFQNFTEKEFHHGVQTHRIQFAAIYLDMKNSPARYATSLPTQLGSLYSFIGDSKLEGRLLFQANTKFKSIFSAFDSMEFNNGSSPEFLRELFIKGIGGKSSL